MEQQLSELSSQYEISESTSRQFQEQVLHLQKTLGEENAVMQKRLQEQAQQLEELASKYEASQKVSQQHEEKAQRYQEEAQGLQQSLDAVSNETATLTEQSGISQARITELGAAVASLAQEKEKLQDTLNLVRPALHQPVDA
jgi:chromosome segregation ATPase